MRSSTDMLLLAAVSDGPLDCSSVHRHAALAGRSWQAKARRRNMTKEFQLMRSVE
jgi:hypothetical protein